MKMRRILAVTVALGLGLSTVALSQAGGSALADPAAAADPRISPPEGQSRVKGADIITFGGTAAPGAQLLQGRLLSLNPDGELDSAYILTSLTLNDGQFGGQTTYPGPEFVEAQDGSVVLEVTMSLDGAEQVIRSNGIRIDVVRPYIVSTALIDRETVRVEFSEPVHIEQPVKDGDLFVEWRVDGTPPTDVEKPEPRSAIRDLKLASALGEDDTPLVELPVFLPGGASLEWVKHWYQDEARLQLSGAVNRTTTARDLVAPETPALDTIAGQNNDGVNEIFTNDRTPTFTLSGLTPNHIGQVYMESNGAPGFQRSGKADALIGEAVAGSDGLATVQVDEAKPLGNGALKLYGVARDRALCQPSDPADGECPNHSTAAPGFLTIDLNPPVAQSVQATLRGAPENPIAGEYILKVDFSEAISPEAGNEADWTVPGTVIEDVTGVNDERIVDVATPVLGGTPVLWTQPAEGGVRYRDRAGNLLETFQLPAINGIPPQVTLDPDLDDLLHSKDQFTRIGHCPSGTQASQCGFLLSGKVQQATHLQIYRETPEGPVALFDGLGRTLPADCRQECFWLERVTLAPNAKNKFLVEGVRLETGADGNPSDIRGPKADVRDIVNDIEAPVVAINGQLGRLLHDGKLGYKGQDVAGINWAAQDQNFVPGAIRIQYSIDDGKSWTLIKDGEGGPGGAGPLTAVYNWLVAKENTEKAKVRVSATDEVGFTASATSNLFVIDSEPPTFEAQTIDATHVRIIFSEGIQLAEGDDGEPESPPQDWLIHEQVGDQTVKIPAGALVVDKRVGGLAKELILTTGIVPDSAPPLQQQIDPNDTPVVQYEPLDQDQQLMQQLRDRADNLLSDRVKTARDKIAPLAPTDLAARQLIRERTEPIEGRAEPDPANDVMVRRVSPGATFSDGVDVAQSGSGVQSTPIGVFQVQVGLATDRVNSYEVWIQDKATNKSPVVTVKIENDSTKPRVKLSKPRRVRKSGRRYVTVRWRTIEKHKGNVDIYFRLKGRGASKRLRTLVKGTADDGSFTWRYPKSWRGLKFKVTVFSRDKAGNRGGKTYSRYLRLK